MVRLSMEPLACKVYNFYILNFLTLSGWRVNMEDSHIAKFNIAPETNIFGVFDGHGGRKKYYKD